ncbi:penicillin-binding protein 2 [uncultured Abyssibacter sp.]|uniref:penicillin-binding protein 2 n=1 Tax=uncultured Abyssibacter sp. TaxID=2320202 RepID=UPI0032B20F00
MAEIKSLKNPLAERQLTLFRAIIAGLGVVILSLVLVGRLVQLQLLDHDVYATRSDDNRMRVRIIAPARGLIYDRNGIVLAENLPTYQLEIVPEQVEDVADTVTALAELIDIPDRDRERFYRRVDQEPSFRSIPLRTRLTPEEVAAFEVNRQDFKGVEIHAALTRRYPLGRLAAHAVGYVGSLSEADAAGLDPRRYRGTQRIGKVGVEAAHESLLHGEPGSKIIEANAQGRTLRDLEYQGPVAGENLYLTLDSRIQEAAVTALGQHDGAVVAIDPTNGDILALVSQPSFDPHLFVDGIDYVTYAGLNADPGRPLFNRALQGQYPPGSTVKPVMALAGLDAGVVTPRHREMCIGYFMLPDNERRYRDWKRRGHGLVDMHDAIAQSCDVYFYQLALDIGIDHIHDFLSQFGLGQILGVDLPGEKPGLLPSRDWKRNARNEAWYPGETLNIGIGQGFMTATPLQLAHMTAMVAVRGHGYRPRILAARQEPGTRDLIHFEPTPVEPVNVADSGYWDRIAESMEAVVHSVQGTATRSGAGASYRIAGKSGTAQVTGLSQEDEEAPDLLDVPRELRDHALFIAYAPADAPKIAVAVIAEHAGSGGRVAGPIARAVMDALLEPES